ncbi:hypothetical protein FRC09_011415 [Ceratobasidium sp. 395]|nr:hypothetical protein FRC09_011415 [Ceratobasidium sp. 395]
MLKFDCDFMVYNAVFLAYLLLSAFKQVGERERLSVELILDLSVSYNLDYGRIAMSRDVYGKSRIFLTQLAKLAERHGDAKVPEGTDFGYIEAHALLLAIVKSLVAHLCPYEHKEVQTSLPEAYKLLDLPLPKLRSAVEVWSQKNFEIALQTTPLPRTNFEQQKDQQTRSLPRMKTRTAKRYGLNIPDFSPSPVPVCSDPRVESINFSPTDTPESGEPNRPWWVDRPTGGRVLGIGRCAISAEELGSPTLSVCTSSGGLSSGPVTPALTNPEYWSDRMGYGKDGHEQSTWGLGETSEVRESETADTRDIPRTIGRKLRKGLKAIFSASNTSNTA